MSTPAQAHAEASPAPSAAGERMHAAMPRLPALRLERRADHVELDALFAPPSLDEVAAVWDTFRKDFRADGFTLLGEPAEREGVTGQLLEYYSRGLRIYGSLYRPADNASGPFPPLIANHPAIFGIPDLWAAPGEPGGAFAAMCRELAGAGNVVLLSAYRGEPAPVGISDGRIEVGKGETDDVLDLLECRKTLPYVDVTRIGMWGKTLPYVDVTRIGMWGSSHGGWTTA